MAKKKAAAQAAQRKPSKPAGDWRAPRLPGKRFVVTGSLSFGTKEQFAATLQKEQATLQDNLTSDVDYLLVGETKQNPTAAELKAEKLNAKGAKITIIDEVGFLRLLRPSPEEAVAMLQGGGKGHDRWQSLVGRWRGWKVPNSVTISGADFSNLSFTDVDFESPRLEDCDFQSATFDSCRFHTIHRADFRGAVLEHTAVYDAQDCNFAGLKRASQIYATGCNLDRANLKSAHVPKLIDCSAVGADLTDCHINPATYQRTNLTRAIFRQARASYSKFIQVVFRLADMQESDFDKCKFDDCDFSDADLTAARLENNQFRNCKFAKAKMARLQANRSSFAGCDLRGADLRQANLADCNLKGSNLAKANFSGANVRGAKFDKGAEKAAIGLELSQSKKTAKVGPHLAALEQIVKQCRRASTLIRLKNNGVDVTLEFGFYAPKDASSYENVYDTRGNSVGRPGPGNSVRSCFLEMGRKWSPAVLDADSVEANFKVVKVPKAELLLRATLAWFEAFGEQVPPDRLLALQAWADKALLSAAKRGGR